MEKAPPSKLNVSSKLRKQWPQSPSVEKAVPSKKMEASPKKTTASPSVKRAAPSRKIEAAPKKTTTAALSKKGHPEKMRIAPKKASTSIPSAIDKTLPVQLSGTSKTGGAIIGGMDPCTRSDSPEEHGRDPNYAPGCECVAYEADREADEADPGTNEAAGPGTADHEINKVPSVVCETPKPTLLDAHGEPPTTDPEINIESPVVCETPEPALLDALVEMIDHGLIEVVDHAHDCTPTTDPGIGEEDSEICAEDPRSGKEPGIDEHT